MLANYAMDHKGFLFPASSDGMWYQNYWLSTLHYPREDTDWVSHARVLRCATWDEQIGYSYTFSYGIAFGGVRLGDRFNLTGASPGEVILVGENTPNRSSPINAPVNKMSDGYWRWSADAHRHGRWRSNHLFLDFSVSAEPARRFTPPFDSWLVR
jgi:hypothetical protein